MQYESGGGVGEQRETEGGNGPGRLAAERIRGGLRWKKIEDESLLARGSQYEECVAGSREGIDASS